MNEMMTLLDPRNLRDAASNVTRKMLSGRLADLRPAPSEPIERGPRRSLHRYRPSGKVIPTGPPVLLVPPPASSASAAFDLRRGCSLAEHLVATGRRAYLLDLGPIGDEGQDLDEALRTWVDEMLPRAVRQVAEDVGGQPVQLVGWCLGGILSVLTAAAHPDLPVASVASVAAPVDFEAGPGDESPRRMIRFTGEAEAALLAVFGGIHRARTAPEYRIPVINKYLARPVGVLTHLDDADFLAQIEALDAFAAEMLVQPRRTVARVYERLARSNELVRGEVAVGDRTVALKDLRVPVLAIAGRDDLLAPWRSVHPLTRLLPGSPDVRFAVEPGGHLGVLAGRRARTTTWTRLDAWLAEGAVRHGMRAPRAQRERRIASRS